MHTLADSSGLLLRFEFSKNIISEVSFIQVLYRNCETGVCVLSITHL